MLDNVKVENILKKIENGEKITRKNNILYRGEKDTRKENLKYLYNNVELKEYSKCSNDIFYFIETYCDFDLNNPRLEILNNYLNNRLTINMCSNESGYYRLMSCIFLWESIFQIDKTIFIHSDKIKEGIVFIDIFYDLYKKLPFFLKPGIKVKNQKYISLDNGYRIRTQSGKYSGIGFGYDVILCLNFAYDTKNKSLINQHFPVVMASSETKMILHSAPNGYNIFERLVRESELKEGHPKKNLFKTIRTYWWEFNNRDDKWKEDKIKDVGEEHFKRNFDLEF